MINSPETMMMTSTGWYDYSSDLPEECLAGIFAFLGEIDRNTSSEVCRRWLSVERQTRYSLSLVATPDLRRSIPNLLSRFTAVTVLSLRCDSHVSIGDDDLTLISLHCSRDLTTLKLTGCREITHAGMSNFGRNCRNLKNLSCHFCSFGAKAMNAVLKHCALEFFSVKRLQGIDSGIDAEPIGAGTAADTLEKICLKGILNAQCFSKLLEGSRKLKSIKLFWCFGNLDTLLKSISNTTAMVEIRLKWIRMSNIGLVAISNYSILEKLHVARAKGNEENVIDDKGLMAIGERCVNLRELILVGANPTCLSLCLIGRNCCDLEKMVLARSETVGDDEMKCIGDEFLALKKLWIRDCEVTNRGVEAIVNGCLNLVKLKVSSCREVTVEAFDSMDSEEDEDSSSCDESDDFLRCSNCYPDDELYRIHQSILNVVKSR